MYRVNYTRNFFSGVLNYYLLTYLQQHMGALSHLVEWALFTLVRFGYVEALLGEVMHVLHEMMLFHFFVGVVTECRLCLIQVTCFMVFLCCGCFVFR